METNLFVYTILIKHCSRKILIYFFFFCVKVNYLYVYLRNTINISAVNYFRFYNGTLLAIFERSLQRFLGHLKILPNHKEYFTDAINDFSARNKGRPPKVDLPTCVFHVSRERSESGMAFRGGDIGALPPQTLRTIRVKTFF